MKNVIFTIIVFIALISLSSCKTDDSINNNVNTPVDTSTFILPLEIGNYWNYPSISTVSDIRPDSILHFFTEYPIYGSGTLSSVQDTLLNGTLTRQFSNNYIENSVTYISKIFYIQNDTSLLQYAYSISSSSDIFPDLKTKLYYKFNGKLYNSPRELLFNTEYEMNMTLNDTLIYENPAPAALLYPIVKGREWLYRNFYSNTINKKYLNFENLTVGSIIASCIKTNLFWGPVNFAEVYDYYSKYGKLRHYLYANDVIVTDEFGHELGKIDLKDISNVTSFYVAEILP